MRHLCRHAIALGWLLAIVPTATVAQTIAGRVVERGSRRPLRHAPLGLIAGDSIVAKTTSDTAGIFYLLPTQPGLYRIVVVGEQDSLFFSDTVRATGDPATERQILLEVPTTMGTYFEFEVEKQAAPKPHNPGPRYPDELRSANVEGEVLVQFIVDVDGHPKRGTVKVLRSTDRLFTQAVLDVLPRMNFYPAEVNGRKVPQLVFMPFQFALVR